MIKATQWVINKKFDTIFFLGSVLVGLLYFLLLLVARQHAFAITAVVWVVFAQAHFGSTWFIYFDKKNRQYYEQNAWIYYYWPIIIFVSVLVLGYFNQTLLVVLVSVASLYHVTKQNVGILQIYRARNKEFDKNEKRLEISALFAWSLFFSGYGALSLQSFRFLITLVLPIARAVVWLTFAVAVAASLGIIYFFTKREDNSLPKNIFLVTSLLMYAPYLYAAVILVDAYQMEIATLTSLIAHYLQYMGLVWLINRNKYGGASEYAKENPFLHSVSSSTVTIIVAIMAYAILMAFFRWGIPMAYGTASKIIPNIALALASVHFFIDSFIWKFRNPYYKETVLPFVKPVEPTYEHQPS